MMIEIMSKIKCIKCDYMAKDIEDMMCHIEKEHVDVFNMIEPMVIMQLRMLTQMKEVKKLLVLLKKY
jgi:uncharacterized C2H2 Zn-finger protein